MTRPTDGIPNAPYKPNAMWQRLRLERYFDEISADDDLLASLYVNSTLTDIPSPELEPLFNRAYGDLLLAPGVHYPDGQVALSVEQLKPDVDCAYIAEFIQGVFRSRKRPMSVRRQRSSTRLLVLLGGIGEGKSTLLNYFFRIYAPEHCNLPGLYRINLDFVEYVTVPPARFTSRHLAEQFLDIVAEDRPDLFAQKDKLLAVLKEPLELERGMLDLIGEREGPEERERQLLRTITRIRRNPLAVLAGAVNYLAVEEGKKVIVTLDNVDRLRPECQSRAVSLFRLALRQLDCCAIVCVREYTYGRLLEMTEWGFEYPLLYHKRPPDFASVLKRRFTRMPAPLGSPDPLFKLGGNPVHLEQRQRFVENLAKFLWERGMGRMLLRITNGNVRQMLSMVKAFLSFYDLDLVSLFAATFYRVQEEPERLRLTANFDNFVRAIIVGNHKYYSSRNRLTAEARETFVLNLLGGPPERPLLPYRLLGYIRKYGIAHKEPMIRKAACLGVKRGQIKDILSSFFSSYLVESMQGLNLSEVEDIIITRKGEYYYDELCTLATYAANVMNDTSWSDMMKPHEQSDSPAARARFLLRGVENVFHAETQEVRRISKWKRASYRDFLLYKPYSERLCVSVLAHLRGLDSRGVRLTEDVYRGFERLLEEIHVAERKF